MSGRFLFTIHWVHCLKHTSTWLVLILSGWINCLSGTTWWKLLPTMMSTLKEYYSNKTCPFFTIKNNFRCLSGKINYVIIRKGSKSYLNSYIIILWNSSWNFRGTSSLYLQTNSFLNDLKIIIQHLNTS